MLKFFFRLIFDFYEYLLLFILVALSFTVLLMNEVPQVRAIQGDIADIFSFIHYPNMWINQLSNLVKENQRLKEDNLRLSLLNAELKESYIENQRLRGMLNFVDSTHFDIVPARVMNRGTTPVFNSILIDVGSSHGIGPNMAVISTEGVIGKTVSVGSSTTLAQIFTDVNFRISVKFQTSRVFGIMQWHFEGLAEVREIPKTVIIHPGEKVITSGYSDIYPAGLLIGEVLDLEPSGDGLYQVAVIQPYVDINSIEEVFVILSRKCYKKL